MAQMRGTVMGAFALGYSFGQLPCAIGLEVLQKTAPLEFRRIFYSEFTIVGLWLIPLFMVPESPVWLASKGKHERGKKALAHLVGKVEDFDLDHEYAVIVDEIERSRRGAKHSWKTLFVGSNLKRTCATAIVPALQYFIGVPLIYGQTTYFFQIAGLEDPFIGNLIITILTVVFVVVGNWFILDRAPRRTALLTAIVGSALLLCIIGALGCIETTPKVAAALIAMCSLWVVVYSCTFAPVYWVTLGEIPTPSIRQMTITLALVHMSAWGAMWTYIVPILLSPQKAGLGTKTAFIFAGTQVVFFPRESRCGRADSSDLLLPPRDQGPLVACYRRAVRAWHQPPEVCSDEDGCRGARGGGGGLVSGSDGSEEAWRIQGMWGVADEVVRTDQGA